MARLPIVVLVSLVAAAWAGTVAAGAPATVDSTDDVEGEYAAASWTGNATCTGSHCIAVSGDGDADCNGEDRSCGTVSINGDAHGCSDRLACLAAAGRGNATGRHAVSGFGNASSCHRRPICHAISGSGDADDAWVAGSGSGNSSGQFSASGGGESTGAVAASAIGDAHGDAAGISGVGGASGDTAVSAAGAAHGDTVGAASATGDATGRYGAVSLFGDATCTLDRAIPIDLRTVRWDVECAAVSAAGNASGGTPVSALGKCNGHMCVDVQRSGDAEGYWFAASVDGNATCHDASCKSVRVLDATDSLWDLLEALLALGPQTPEPYEFSHWMIHHAERTYHATVTAYTNNPNDPNRDRGVPDEYWDEIQGGVDEHAPIASRYPDAIPLFGGENSVNGSPGAGLLFDAFLWPFVNVVRESPVLGAGAQTRSTVAEAYGADQHGFAGLTPPVTPTAFGAVDGAFHDAEAAAPPLP